ncbi:helix-turn-helix transcriptional regulator [Amnibacterium endophyticum]|uniref:LuxR C-terminal-related transcriptional regulator n=1 Tax=Amnibacterium endophyticum TaxID=2109337 RepID=A0ABW4LHD5_9MICO
MLLGRTPELTSLARLASGVAVGRGGARVVRGPIGSGRTSLLDELERRATDLAVLRLQAPTTSQSSPYAGLQQLLPQLRCPEGSIEGGPGADLLIEVAGSDPEHAERPARPDAVGAALLAALDRRARDRPVLVLADDADTFDDETMLALRFVAGRASARAIGVVFTTTLQLRVLEQIGELELTPLSPADSSSLLEEHRPGTSAAERDVLARTANGNPLALLTVPVPRTPESGLHPIEIGGALRAAFARRVPLLRPEVRAALAVLTLVPDLPLHQLEAVTAHLGQDVLPRVVLGAAGWVRIEAGRAGLPDAITRAALVDVLPAAVRREAADALLATLSRGDDLRARVLAAVSTAPDAAVAEEIARAARRIGSRRGPAESIPLWSAAARLSPDARSASARLVAAGVDEWTRGSMGAARELHRRGRLASPDAVVDELGALLELTGGDCSTAARLVARAAPGRSEPELLAAAAMWITAAWRAGSFDPLAMPDDQVLLQSLAGPMRAAVRRVLEAWRFAGADAADQQELWRIPPAALAAATGVQDEALRRYRAFVEESRARGASTLVSTALAEQSFLEALSGRLPRAAAAAAEAADLATASDAPVVLAHALLAQTWIAALRGDRTETERLAEHVGALARASGNRVALGLVRWHRGAAALFTGATEAAVDLLAPLRDPRSESHHPTAALLAAVDLGEAAVRIGDIALAQQQQALLHHAATSTGSTWSGASARFIGAMIADGDAVESELHGVRADLIGERGPFLRARVELVLGEWLRRARRREDSRAFLANAADEFDALGAPTLAARAREALAMTTGAHRTGSPGEEEVLTAQEARIAALAADGASNKSIAAALFISPRTVGHHLSVVYRKLSVASRSDLAGVLAPSAEA